MLSHQDKCDLLGLAGGYGTDAGNARAARLLEQGDEAGTFIRDVKNLGRSLEPVPVEEEGPLAPELVTRITAGAHSRWLQRRRRRFLVSLAGAAGLALVFFGFRYVYWPNASPGRAPGTVLLFSSGYAVGGLDAPRHEKLVHNQEVSTSPEQYALVQSSRDTSCALAGDSRCLFESKAIVLGEGAVAVKTREAVGFSAASIRGQLESGQAVIIRDGSRVEISLYEGSAELSCKGVNHQLRPGQRAVSSEGKLEILEEIRPYPSWATRAFSFPDTP